MNYIELINGFWRSHEEHSFNTTEVAVYMYLLQVCNICLWKNPFKRNNSKIEADLGISFNTLKNARNRLRQVGLIDFETRNGSPNVTYTLSKFDKVTNEVSAEVGNEVTNEVGAEVLPTKDKLNKNQTKPNIELKKNSASAENFFFKIGLNVFEQRPSEYLFTNHRTVIESWMMNLFRGADLQKIFDQLDIECFGKDFTDDNHIKNCFKKIAERFSKNAQNGKNNKRINSTSTPEQGRDFGGF